MQRRASPRRVCLTYLPSLQLMAGGRDRVIANKLKWLQQVVELLRNNFTATPLLKLKRDRILLIVLR